MDFEWPEDTAFLTVDTHQQMLEALYMLVSLNHIFVVNGKSGQIAMSKDAARDIGVITW